MTIDNYSEYPKEVPCNDCGIILLIDEEPTNVIVKDGQEFMRLYSAVNSNEFMDVKFDGFVCEKCGAKK